MRAGRAELARITDEGRKVLHEAVTSYEQALHEVFGRLTMDRDLGPLLTRLLKTTAAGQTRKK